MYDEIVSQAILFAVSFIANLFASVSGGGAGFVQLPLLILMGLPFATALGTHKVAVVFLGVGALSKKFKDHGSFNLDRQLSFIMLFIGCPAVVAGTVIVISIPADIASISVGLLTVASGIYTLYKKNFGGSNLEHRSKTRVIIGTLLMILIGLLSGSLSSGAGLFSTLTLVMVFGMDLKRAIMHTMLYVATIWNAVGAFTVGALTAIHWHWVPVLIIATFLGSYLGTALLIRLNVKLVRLCFSTVAILSGVLLIYTAVV